jgi:uncharacterized protein YjiS (DUF1127 family)
MRTTNAHSRPLPAHHSLKASLGWVCQQIFAWLEKRETRRTLQDLTEDQLRDIGLTRREAKMEVSKSFFWD